MKKTRCCWFRSFSFSFIDSRRNNTQPIIVCVSFSAIRSRRALSTNRTFRIPECSPEKRNGNDSISTARFSQPRSTETEQNSVHFGRAQLQQLCRGKEKESYCGPRRQSALYARFLTHPIFVCIGTSNSCLSIVHLEFMSANLTASSFPILEKEANSLRIVTAIP